MPHFFISSKNVNKDLIRVDDAENYQHIVKSLRMNIGKELKLIDENSIEYFTQIKEISKNEIITKVISSKKSERKLDFELYLAQSPLRSDAQTTIVEKATELGVKGIYPVYTDNCALKKSVIERKIEKWQSAMYAASKQCERADIPTCFSLSTLKESIESQKFDKVIALCEKYTEKSLKSYLADCPIKNEEKVLLIIGPEGGFSEDEFAYFKDNHIPMLTLGNLILKAETAVVVTIGNIVYESGR